MGNEGRRTNCVFARRLVIFLILFLVYLKIYSLSGTDYLISAKIVKGSKVIHIVKLNLPQDIDEKLLKFDINKDINENAKIALISKVIDGNNFIIEIKIEYVFDKLGFIKIPSLRVIYNDDVYLTSEFEVVILREDEFRSLGLPVGLYWDFNKKEIYEYQSVGFVLRSNWLLSNNIKSVASFFNAVKDAMIDRTPIFENINYRTFNSKEILDVPLYNFILTPLRGSKIVVIPSVSFNIGEDIIRMSPEIFLKIKSIPEEVKSLAVGSFKIDYDFPNSTSITQDAFTILIKITGQGNLPHIRFPEIETYNSRIIYNKKNYNFEPSKDGYRGSISNVYTIKPDNKGNLFVNIGDFVYLDPDDDKVYRLNGKRLKYEYYGEFKNNNSNQELLSDFNLLSYYDILKHKNKTFLFFVPIYYLILIPGILFSLAMFIKHKKFFIASGCGLIVLILTLAVSLNAINDGSLSEDNINDLINDYKSSNYSDALNKIDNIIKRNSNYSGLWLNRALILSKMDRSFDAIYSAYKAFFTSPNNDIFYKIIDFIETKNGINENIRNNSFVFSNIFFIISLILITILIIVVSYRFYAKNLKRIILFLLLSMTCFTLFQTYYFYLEQQSEIGIIRGDLVSLYKVPDNFSRSWKFLKGNISVYVLDKKDDFVLIQTSHGLKGWIHKNFIVSVKDDLI
ncbi:SH3 domain-containing protein [Borrelia hispanica]|uniref:SH3 domain-containing protein n=1 Tax=Borrelia hispanica TaxID=40835 RepID=UPI0009FFEC46|nr:SH3 domain-containing protein [Borrelia hispanica]